MMERFIASLETISRYTKPNRFLLGVSGGSDSVALLHMLRSREDIPPIKVVHFDHQQRGVDSDMDREFVMDLCQTLRVPVDCFLWSDAKQSLSNKSFSQALARDWRRSTMENIARSEVCTVVLTAHHKDDSEETLLLKLLRGVHLTNISGLPILKEMDESGITWARPLIDIRKHELQAYLEDEGHTWREDATNKSSKYLRNRVRNELIPLLRDMMDEGSLERRLQHVEEQAKELRDDLDERTQEGINIDTEFLPLPDTGRLDAVYRHALHQWADRQGCTISYEQTKRIEQQLHDFPDRIQWCLNIGLFWDVQRNGSILRLINTSVDSKDGQANPNGAVVSLLTSPERNYDEHKNTEAVELYLSASTDSGDVAFSQMWLGDFPGRATFTPPWKNKPMKLNDFLRGQKVPLHLRSSTEIIVACDRIAAVKICTSNVSKAKWVVDASFSSSSSSRKVFVYALSNR